MKIGEPLNLSDLRGIYEAAPKLEFTLEASARIDRGAKAIADVIKSGATVYGVNTGFGLLANTEIPNADLVALQRNLVLSHACGVGPHLPDEIVRLILCLKIASLSRGPKPMRYSSRRLS